MKKPLSICLLFLAHISIASAAVTLTNFVTGIQGAALTNVENRLKTQQESHKGNLTPETVQRLYQDSKKEIKNALKPYGYLKPTIESQLYHRGDSWQAHYRITPGPALKVTQLTIKLTGAGTKDQTYQNFLAQFPLKQGQAFNADNYNKAKQRFYDIAANYGYFKAKMIDSSIKIDLKNYTCAINFNFNTGPRYRFGNVSFNHTPFKESFLRKYIPFKKGQFFQESLTQKFQTNLNSSNYFEGVQVKSHPKRAQTLLVPITVQLTPRKAKRYSLGVGYGTDTGPRALFGIDWRRVTSTGHQFKTLIRVSKIQNRLQGDYIIPGHHPVTDQYKLSVGGEKYSDKETGQFYTTGKATASYITSLFGWHHNLSLNFITERYNLQGYPAERSNMLYPSFQMMRTRSDDPLRPTRGYQITFLVRGATSKIASNASFYQVKLKAKWLRNITHNQRIVLRGTIGYTGINNINDLPLSMQFSAGGSDSIRGYQYRKLIYGRYITVGSIELQQRVVGNWYILGFYDAGTVSNKVFGPWSRGAGPGIMWLSPFGAVKLTVAKPFDASNSKAWLIQFTMGPEL